MVGRIARKIETANEVLFMQHSSAGDVYMTTKCFKGLKERYKLPLHYMTSSQYMDIVEGNPYISKVLSWNEETKNRYGIVLNPHSEEIMPNSMGRNCNSILSDFYWKILMVKPDNFYIRKKEPENAEISKTMNKLLDSKVPICIVHTTGGDPSYRTYKYMEDVCNGLLDRYVTIQVGGRHDFPASANIDLRGYLSFQETAWVVDKAKIAVTVDSFVSHLVGSFGISQVCLFGSGNAYVVRPDQVRGKLICLSPDYAFQCPALGPCSGVYRECKLRCTGIHNPKLILSCISEIEKWERKNNGYSSCSYKVSGGFEG